MIDRTDLLIEADELAEIIDSPDLRLFDSSVFMQDKPDAAERYRQGHIPGAVFLDHQSLSDSESSLMYMIPDEETLAQAIGSIGISNDSPVVVYAASDLCWATRIWWVLRYAGHRNVRVLNGGIEAWQGELETTVNSYSPASFTTNLSPGMFANFEDVVAAGTDAATCVINTLPEAIYNGEVETGFSGHIAESVNHPMYGLMDGQRLKPDEEIRAFFSDNLKQEKMITYCGGGIAATLNACAAQLAGIEDVAVYDGSLYEWVSREQPLEKSAE